MPIILVLISLISAIAGFLIMRDGKTLLAKLGGFGLFIVAIILLVAAYIFANFRG